jgi:hypothetical protein
MSDCSKPVTLRPSPWSPPAFTGCLLLRSLKLRFQGDPC